MYHNTFQSVLQEKGTIFQPHLIVFLFFCLTDIAYPLAVFLGIMGLKAGAYLQPFTHKYLFRK
jgi:hypothetical protein